MLDLRDNSWIHDLLQVLVRSSFVDEHDSILIFLAYIAVVSRTLLVRQLPLLASVDLPVEVFVSAIIEYELW